MTKTHFQNITFYKVIKSDIIHEDPGVNEKLCEIKQWRCMGVKGLIMSKINEHSPITSHQYVLTMQVTMPRTYLHEDRAIELRIRRGIKQTRQCATLMALDFPCKTGQVWKHPPRNN